MFQIKIPAGGLSRYYSFFSPVLVCAALFVGSMTNATAQIAPAKESLSDLYPGKAYSPYAQRSFPDRVFWGDTHVHTNNSLDARGFGVILGPEGAYRFARGEVVEATNMPKSEPMGLKDSTFT